MRSASAQLCQGPFDAHPQLPPALPQQRGRLLSLSADQISYLKQYNVSDAVMTEMQATAYRAQFVTPQPVYVAPPQPAYSVGVAVGGR